MKNKTKCAARAHERAATVFGLLSENLGRNLVCGLALLVVVFGLSESASAETGLVASWHMDEGSGNIIYDETTNNNGIIYGAGWTDGVCENALGFDGVNDYAIVADNPNLKLTEEITVECWIKSNDFSVRKIIMAKHELFQRGWLLQWEQKPSPLLHLRFMVNRGTPDVYDWCVADYPLSNLETGKWYHVVGTYSTHDDTARLYVNGVEVAHQTKPTDKKMSVNNEPLLIGKHPDWTGYFNGIIDEVKIYNRALTAEEIQQHYNNPCGKIEATIDIDPFTLNLNSKGKWITAYIELPEDYNCTNINGSTVKLNDTIPAVSDPKYGFVNSESSYCFDYDSDGIIERMVKFDRSAVQDILEVGDEVEIVVTGELYDGTRFEGSDTIRVIDK
ncbi:hypothetical protein BEH94_07900 [Candidatus Altiarchaeales archaeon WOR_SM1_SCG]|nr:hypothetical protein BEH94_07900 [Candidatus Altiarchaeales archaeon WOR_SM1_SCG]